MSVFRGTDMRIKLKQRKNWGKWQEVCTVRKSWPRSVSGSPRWSEEVRAPVSIDSARWPLLLQDESSPSWVYPQLRWRWWQTRLLRFYSSGTLDLALERRLRTMAYLCAFSPNKGDWHQAKANCQALVLCGGDSQVRSCCSVPVSRGHITSCT